LKRQKGEGVGEGEGEGEGEGGKSVVVLSKKYQPPTVPD